MNKLSDFKPLTKNPNKHTQRGLGMLEKSFERLGYVTPMTAASDGTIIDGNARLEMSATKMPDEPIVIHHDGTRPIIAVRDDIKTGEDKKALEIAIAANRTAQVDLEWDEEILKDFKFKGFEIDDFFSERDFTELFGNNMKPGNCDPNETPAPPPIPKCKEGDLWILGEHRLLCGDSTNPQHVDRLLARAKPFIMVTDPPYGVEYDPNWRNVAAEEGHLSYGASAIGKVENDSVVDWSAAWTLSPCDVVYTWSPPGDHVLITGKALVDSGFEIRSMIIWKKAHFAISRGAYHYQHEPCWYAVRKGRKALWCGDRTQSTIWEIDHIKNETGHGTQKPVECMARPIRNHGGRADDVYDPFLGSGTTIIACEQLERRCFGLEISPTYCDVILSRWAKFTGKDPIRDDGKRWSEFI